jgi:hypothetical protein
MNRSTRPGVATVVAFGRSDPDVLADVDRATAEALRLTLIGRRLEAERARLEAGFAELAEREASYDALARRLEARGAELRRQQAELAALQDDVVRRRRRLARELGGRDGKWWAAAGREVPRRHL